MVHDMGLGKPHLGCSGACAWEGHESSQHRKDASAFSMIKHALNSLMTCMAAALYATGVRLSACLIHLHHNR